MAKKEKKSPKKATKKSSPKPSSEPPSNPAPEQPSEPSEGRRMAHAKRSGKRGPMPLDPLDDFQAPVKANGEQVGEPLFPEAPVKKPRQPRLPTMEDPEIEELE